MVKNRDRVGLNTHVDYLAYKNNIPDLISFLNWLGITRVRDNSANAPALLPGFKVQLVIDSQNTTTVRNRITTALTGTNKAVRIECVNEPKAAAVPTVRTVNVDIVSTVAGRVPVVQSALPYPDAPRAQALGTLTGASLGNVHSYRSTRGATEWLAYQKSCMGMMQYTSPGLPWQVTETGQTTYSGTKQSYDPVTDAVYASQIVDMVIGWWNLGAQEVYLYEAHDEADKQNPATYDTPSEGFFGLTDKNWNPKPAAVALKAWLDDYGDDDPDGPITTPGSDLLTGVAAGYLYRLNGVNVVPDAVKYRTGGVTYQVFP